jgi:hypothetical protein
MYLWRRRTPATSTTMPRHHPHVVAGHGVPTISRREEPLRSADIASRADSRMGRRSPGQGTGQYLRPDRFKAFLAKPGSRSISHFASAGAGFEAVPLCRGCWSVTAESGNLAHSRPSRFWHGRTLTTPAPGSGRVKGRSSRPNARRDLEADRIRLRKRPSLTELGRLVQFPPAVSSSPSPSR